MHVYWIWELSHAGNSVSYSYNERMVNWYVKCITDQIQHEGRQWYLWYFVLHGIISILTQCHYMLKKLAITGYPRLDLHAKLSSAWSFTYQVEDSSIQDLHDQMDILNSQDSIIVDLLLQDGFCLHSWLVLADIKLMTLWGPWYAYKCGMLFGHLPLYSLNYSHLHSVGTDQIPACLAEYQLLPTYDTLRMLSYGYGYLNLYKWNISFSVSGWGVYIC